MSLFIEYHLIQSFPPSSLNRDDTGSPKEAIFGGIRRSRVSSQCWKRAIRLAFRNGELLDPKFHGTRTKKLKELLEAKLAARGRKDAGAKIDYLLSGAGLKLKNDGKTEYLLFLGAQEIDSLAVLIDRTWDELGGTFEEPRAKSKKEAKTSVPAELTKQTKLILNGGKAVDVALFGRMLADLPEVNQEASCQVAHAISTHATEREFDYYTAVDDQIAPGEPSASMIGQIEFKSATFYRYALIDPGKLLQNLHSDRELCLAGIRAFTEALAEAIPTGRQNSFAAHNLPSFIGVAIRHKLPLNLANAFETPVMPSQGKAPSVLSVQALAAYEPALSAVYGDKRDSWGYVDLTGAWPASQGTALNSISSLASWIEEQVSKG